METELAKSAEREQREAHLHFSFSQLNTYLTCPMKYGHQYVWGTPWETKPIALPFGKGVHKGAETYYRALMETPDHHRRRQKAPCLA